MLLCCLVLVIYFPMSGMGWMVGVRCICDFWAGVGEGMRGEEKRSEEEVRRKEEWEKGVCMEIRRWQV